MSSVFERVKDRLPLIYVFLSGLGFSIQTLIVKVLSEDSYHASFHCECWYILATVVNLCFREGSHVLRCLLLYPYCLPRYRVKRHRADDHFIILHHESGWGLQSISFIRRLDLYTNHTTAAISHGLSWSCHLLRIRATDTYRRCYGVVYAQSIRRVRP